MHPSRHTQPDTDISKGKRRRKNKTTGMST